MKKKVFVDGSSGTTDCKINERLASMIILKLLRLTMINVGI